MDLKNGITIASIAKVREKDPQDSNTQENEANTAEIEDNTDDQND